MRRNHDDGPYQNNITLITGKARTGKTRLLAKIANEICERDYRVLCIVGSADARNNLYKELMDLEDPCKTYWKEGHIVELQQVDSIAVEYDKVLIDNSCFSGEVLCSSYPGVLGFAKVFIDKGYDEVFVAVESAVSAIDLIGFEPDLQSIRTTFRDIKGRFYIQITALEPYK